MAFYLKDQDNMSFTRCKVLLDLYIMDSDIEKEQQPRDIYYNLKTLSKSIRRWSRG